MPNPLMLATSTPNRAANPDANQRDQQEPKGSTTFQEVLNQDVEAQANNTQTLEIEVDGDPDTLPGETQAVEPHHAPVELQPANPLRTDEGAIAKPGEPDGSAPNGTQAAQVPIGVTAGPSREAQAMNQPARSTTAGDISAANPGILPQTGPKDGKAQHPTPPNTHPVASQPAPPPAGQKTRADGPVEENRLGRQGTNEATTDPRSTHSIASEPHTRPAPPSRGTNPVQMQLQATPQAAEAEKVAPTREGDSLFALGDEPTFQSARDTTSQLTSPHAAARAEVARAIAGQMAAMIQIRPGTGAVEIALHPEELGRVSIVLTGREDGLHMTIAADRPETLDLMRRHIAVLTAEFQKLGYGGMSFDLGTSSNANREGPGSQAAVSFDSETEEPAAQDAPVASRTLPGRGIDMRI